MKGEEKKSFSIWEESKDLKIFVEWCDVVGIKDTFLVNTKEEKKVKIVCLKAS